VIRQWYQFLDGHPQKLTCRETIPEIAKRIGPDAPNAHRGRRRYASVRIF